MNLATITDQLNTAMRWAESGSKLMYCSIAAGLLVGLILFRLFFRNIGGFFHCIGFSVGAQPNSVGAQPNSVGAVQPGLSRSSRLKLLLGALLPAGTGY